MEAVQLRTGNFVVFEACDYEVLGINVIGTPKLNVKAANGKWGVEMCSPGAVDGIEITPGWLKRNGFVVLNKAMPEIMIKHLGGYRYIRYHTGVHYMDFETTNSFQRVPWPVRFVHQMQNACTDYDVNLNFVV